LFAEAAPLRPVLRPLMVSCRLGAKVELYVLTILFYSLNLQPSKSLSTTNGTMRKCENLINYIAARKYIHITIAVHTLSRVRQWLLSDEEEEFSRC